MNLKLRLMIVDIDNVYNDCYQCAEWRLSCVDGGHCQMMNGPVLAVQRLTGQLSSHSVHDELARGVTCHTQQINGVVSFSIKLPARE